jgi:transcriptional regulator with XRE-family HTH domain
MILGKICQNYRIELGYRQIDVANETGYSKENVSSFENGRNDNCYLLLWYISHGLKYDMIREGMKL